MPLELEYFMCCRAGFHFTETEFRTMPSTRRHRYLDISKTYHNEAKNKLDDLEN